MSWDMVTNEKRYWGDWDASVAAAWPGTAISPESCDGAGCCLSNCLAKVAVNAVAGKFGTAIERGPGRLWLCHCLPHARFVSHGPVRGQPWEKNW